MVEEYDCNGKLLYNPEYHENHGKRFSEEELEYMCKYIELDGLKSMAMALGKTENVVNVKVQRLKKMGKFEYYKNLSRHW